jgi:hypothetical protein
MIIDYELADLSVNANQSTAKFIFSTDGEPLVELTLEVDPETTITELKKQAVEAFSDELGKEIDVSAAQFNFHR